MVEVPFSSFKNIVKGSPFVNYILELLIKYIFFLILKAFVSFEIVLLSLRP